MPFFGPFLAQNDVFRFGLVWFTQKPPGRVLMVWNHYPPMGNHDPGSKPHLKSHLWPFFRPFLAKNGFFTVNVGSFPS